MERNNMRSNYVNSGPRSLPHMGKRHNGNSHNGSRLSPPAQTNNHSNNQQDDIINYIFESWNKVSREMERGSEDARYYQEVMPRQMANFRPFNLEEWWGRRFIQSINRKHRS
ncbi:uncharacterized protein LOC116772657 [Danaus plexippus]|uniref:FAM195A like protein n=1 Tax=Danaus plexippus plexippus TaxID=278856 RepID=A0A212ESZ8_DANPL|nr:uncharacterized protein LOC116772657 [Danaus plexippus]OWR44618.1 FAM195A like protein [Danaus plexippus plexippus]